jgi:hypothetical protein
LLGRLPIVDEETKELWRFKVTGNKFTIVKYIFRDPEVKKIRASYQKVCRVINSTASLVHKQPKKFWLGGRNGVKKSP